MKIVPDTSVIISKLIVEEIISMKDKIEEIVIPRIVISEIENMANNHQHKGFEGLEELKNLRFECAHYGIKVTLAGERPTLEEIKLAGSGELDAKIRDVAREHKAVLFTSDKILVSMCEIEGIEVEYLKHPPTKKAVNKIFDYFDNQTMSVHIREGVVPLAKKGKPGDWQLIAINDRLTSHEEIDELITDIISTARTTPNSFIEMDEPGVKVIQLGAMRIVIAQPPFSDAPEITAVKPITKLNLDYYKLSEGLQERLEKRAEGVLIAGSPGAGKSTFAQALADFYATLGKTVKTVEKPRDLQVGPEVSQYTTLAGDFRKTADIMLLIRPDFVIFDELRKTPDFEAFADMRLAGMGLVGVIHSTTAIEAIQRFIGRIDLGMIPSILDTVIYIDDGHIGDVLELRMTVKVPTGMLERDLARPVIEVRDFETHNLRYDIFVFGEQVSVIPVGEEDVKPLRPLSGDEKKQIERIIRKYVNSSQIIITKTGKNSIRIELPADDVPFLIGRKGKTISELEKKLGMKIDVKPLTKSFGNEMDIDSLEPHIAENEKIPIDIRFTKTHVILSFAEYLSGLNIEVLSEDKVIFSGSISKNGEIKIERTTSIAKEVIKIINKGETLYATPK
ncbi:MAG: Flp pilus assembly complex ATPase component TadA [Candidatus Heimdallarchaeota archaeon]|nr:Flp pilus assembly complex ATPase component TadA [Candidatus Heimdallarchaeota archaeon]